MLESIGIDLKLLIAQIVNFGIVLFVLYRFLYKPLLKAMQARTEKIEQGVKHAEEMSQKIAEIEERSQKAKETAEKEALRVIQEAKKEGEAIIKKSQEEGRSQSEAMIAKTKEEMAEEKENILSEVKEEIIQIVNQATAAALKKSETTLNDGLIKETVDKAVKEIK